MRLTIILLILLLAACAAPPAPTATLPPSQPPAAPTDAQSAAPAETAAPNLPVERGTLPPTWTPSVVESPTPTQVTLVPDLTSQSLQFFPTLAACDSFVFDRATTPRTYTLGQPVTITWSAPLGAASYRVTLLDQSLAPLFSEATTGTTFSFPAELFDFGRIYGWDVRPLDINGAQFCLPIGGELTMATG